MGNFLFFRTSKSGLPKDIYKTKTESMKRKRKYGGVVKVKMCYYDWCQSFVAPKYNDYSNAKVNWDSGSQVEEWIHYI